MSETLGYRDLFDRQFYSCYLGHAKPSRAYFEQVLAALQLPPDRVLFLDDQEDNVAGAGELGHPRFGLPTASRRRQSTRPSQPYCAPTGCVSIVTRMGSKGLVDSSSFRSATHSKQSP